MLAWLLCVSGDADKHYKETLYFSGEGGQTPTPPPLDPHIDPVIFHIMLDKFYIQMLAGQSILNIKEILI